MFTAFLFSLTRYRCILDLSLVYFSAVIIPKNVKNPNRYEPPRKVIKMLGHLWIAPCLIKYSIKMLTRFDCLSLSHRSKSKQSPVKSWWLFLIMTHQSTNRIWFWIYRMNIVTRWSVVFGMPYYFRRVQSL